MSKVLFTAGADKDIFEIGDYIARDSPAAAERFLTELRHTFELLAQTPLMGRERPDLGPALRSFPVDDYLLIYTPIQGGVQIVRVLSGYRDLEALF